MKRESLEQARKEAGYTQESLATKLAVSRETISMWERGLSAPHPIHIKKLCKLLGRSPEELGLSKKEMTTIEPSSEILPAITAGITACATLSENGNYAEIQSAATIIESYIPMLTEMLKPSSQRTPVAVAISEALQVRQGNAYHLESVLAAQQYSQSAVEYARIGSSAETLVRALHCLATTYEWPQPPMTPNVARKKALDLARE